MRVQRWSWMAALAALMVFGSGCVVTVTGSQDTYERCGSADTCAGASFCQASSVATTGMSAGNFCTVSGCGAAGPSAACPVDASGASGICVPDGVGGSQCFQGCPTGTECPAGFTCAAPATFPSEAVCVPNGSVAPSCGAQGQACCGGGTCDSGLACGTDGLCALPPPTVQPYEGCTPLGAACGGGTTCVQPRISNPDPSYGFCSLDCAASASECPGSPIPGRSYNCYVLTPGTAGQCFVDCAGADTSCPTGTICTMTTSATGADIRVCMPCPAGMCN